MSSNPKFWPSNSLIWDQYVSILGVTDTPKYLEQGIFYCFINQFHHCIFVFGYKPDTTNVSLNFYHFHIAVKQIYFAKFNLQ